MIPQPQQSKASQPKASQPKASQPKASQACSSYGCGRRLFRTIATYCVRICGQAQA